MSLFAWLRSKVRPAPEEEPLPSHLMQTIYPPKCWRTGRKVGRTIYLQHGDEPSDDDQLIGVMDSPDLAERVVMAVNVLTALARDTQEKP